MIASAATGPTQAPSNAFRWMQLIIGVICMALIANLQYGWTYFVGPMAKAHAWDIGSIQVAFSIFVALETWLTPLEGWIVASNADRAAQASADQAAGRPGRAPGGPPRPATRRTTPRPKGSY